MPRETSKSLPKGLSGSGSARCGTARWGDLEGNHLGGNPLSPWGTEGEREPERGAGGGGKRVRRGRDGEREGLPSLHEGEGIPAARPLLTGRLACRPHAVDSGARAAVAGVGDKGVWLDGDRYVLLPKHGWQGTV